MRTFSDFCIVFLKIYQRFIAPIFISFGVRCRFEPSCSHYTIQSIGEHGVAKGSALGLNRILRCQPLCNGGYDPVPKEFSFVWRFKNG